MHPVRRAQRGQLGRDERLLSCTAFEPRSRSKGCLPLSKACPVLSAAGLSCDHAGAPRAGPDFLPHEASEAERRAHGTWRPGRRMLPAGVRERRYKCY